MSRTHKSTDNPFLPRGFTLVEMMIAIGVITIVVLGMSRYFISSNRSIISQRELDSWQRLRALLETTINDPRQLYISAQSSSNTALARCLKINSSGELDWGSMGTVNCDAGVEMDFTLYTFWSKDGSKSSLFRLSGDQPQDGDLASPCDPKATTARKCLWNVTAKATPHCDGGSAKCARAQSFTVTYVIQMADQTFSRLFVGRKEVGTGTAHVEAREVSKFAPRFCRDRFPTMVYETPVVVGFDPMGWPVCELRAPEYSASNPSFNCNADGSLLLGFEGDRPKCVNIATACPSGQVFAGISASKGVICKKPE